MRHVKGYLRYESDLKSGLIEITANKNYVTEREVKNIEVQLKEVILVLTSRSILMV